MQVEFIQLISLFLVSDNKSSNIVNFKFSLLAQKLANKHASQLPFMLLDYFSKIFELVEAFQKYAEV